MATKTFPAGKVILGAGVLAIVGGFLLKNVLAPGEKVRIERTIRSLAKALENRDTETLIAALDKDFVLDDDLGRTFSHDEVSGLIHGYAAYYRGVSIHFGTMKIDVFSTRAAARFFTTTRWRAPYSNSGTHSGEWQADFIKRRREWKLSRFKVLGEGLYE